MNRITLTFIALLISSLVFAQDAKTIIERVDANQNFRTQAFVGRMVIERSGRQQVKTFIGYAQKEGEKSFINFTNPEDNGVKYLRLDEELWIYFPDADDIMRISGHMLKQGMMGSDISYEDMLSNEELEEEYDYNFIGSETYNGIDCYVVELIAKVETARYASQKLYVDKSNYVAVKTELYARGGRLIKEIIQSDIRRIGSRNIAFKIEVTDLRRRNSKTTVTYERLSQDINIPDEVFTRNYLRR